MSVLQVIWKAALIGIIIYFMEMDSFNNGYSIDPGNKHILNSWSHIIILFFFFFY